MFQDTYNRMNEEVRPDAALKDRVLESAAPKRAGALRPAVAGALALAVVMLAVPVMADYAPTAWKWLQNLTPISTEAETAAHGDGAKVESVANGIRMEVVGITAEEREARVLLRFEYEDGTPVEGIDTPGQVYFDAYHTWYYTGGGSYQTGSEELVELRFTAREGNREEFFNSQVNLIVDSLRIREPEIREVPLALTDCDAITVPYEFSDPFMMFGVGVQDAYQDYLGREEYAMIAPGEAVYAVTDTIGVTGMRYIDGLLHVQILQTVPYDVSSFDVWMEDAQGNRLHAQVWHDFGFIDGSHGRECCFDIPPEALDGYRLMIEVEHGVEGVWKVSFAVNE